MSQIRQDYVCRGNSVGVSWSEENGKYNSGFKGVGSAESSYPQNTCERLHFACPKKGRNYNVSKVFSIGGMGSVSSIIFQRITA